MDLETAANGGAAAASVIPSTEGSFFAGRNIAICLIILAVTLGLSVVIYKLLVKRADAKKAKLAAPATDTVVVPAAAVAAPVSADVKPAAEPVAKVG
jgi:hypothetical protein